MAEPIVHPPLDPFEPIPEWMFGPSVEARQALQDSGRVHPYTCGYNRTDDAHRAYQKIHGGDLGQMRATEDGWECPVCKKQQSCQ